MLSAQSLERSDNFFLPFLHRVGDHTRGLFEADASIVVSATHAFENVEIVFLGCHVKSSQLEIPEKPTFWVVISSVVVSGSLLAFTVTRMRTKIRHASPRHWQ